MWEMGSDMTTANERKSHSIATVRGLLVGLELFVCAAAIYGAVGLCTGSNLPPEDDLEWAGLSSWFWPGLALGVLIGGGALVAAIAIIRGWRNAPEMSLALAALLLFWIAVQIPVVGTSLLQAMIVIIAASIGWLARTYARA